MKLLRKMEKSQRSTHDKSHESDEAHTAEDALFVIKSKKKTKVQQS